MANAFQYNALRLAQSKFERRKEHLGIIEFDDKSVAGIFLGATIQAAVKSASQDGRSVSVTETNHLQGIIKEASGPESLPDLSLSFNDYNEIGVGAEGIMPIRRYMEQWFNLVHNESTGISQSPAIYKGRATWLLLDGQQNVDMAYELIGIFPTNRPSNSFDHSSRDDKTFDVTFSVDYIRVDDERVHLPM